MQKINLNHRVMLFSFLGDETLTLPQRGVGTVLILRGWPHRRFWSGWGLTWSKIAALSGYDEQTCETVYGELLALEWLAQKERGDGAVGYEVPRARIDNAIERQRAHLAALEARKLATEATAHPATVATVATDAVVGAAP